MAFRPHFTAAWIDDDVDPLVDLGHTAEANVAFTKARALVPLYPNLPKVSSH